MPTWSKILLFIVAAFVVVGLLGLAYVYSGAYNVAASNDLAPATRWLFGTVTETSIRSHAEPLAEPIEADTAVLLTGASHYDEMCAMCHGAPGVEMSEFARGMKPEPPEMGHAAEEWSAGELLWILRHGIKHTGMPAFGPTHSEEDLRAVVAFVQQLPEMTPDAYRQWTARAAEAGHAHGDDAAHGSAAADTASTGGDGHTHAPGEEHE